MELLNVRGTTDFMPNDMIIRNRIIDTLKKNFEKYGYMPLETPIINYFDLLKYKYTEDAEILNEIYRLTDQGNRDLGLRYDLTVPFCKYVSMQKDLVLPFRRYEIGKVFRNGPIKLGRAREFYQCDVDVVGISNILIEAEQMSMVLNIFNELGLPVNIKYNNRKLMSGLIELSGISKDKTDDVIGIIDKKEKITDGELLNMLSKCDISNDSINKLMNLFNKSFEEYTKLVDSNDLIKEGIDELNTLNEYLISLNIIDDCIFTPTLARGLSIYTGTVFEFYDKLERLTCSLGGGGRYDKIITNFIDNGNPYPAVGLSFGLEPIFTILKENNTHKGITDIYLVPLDTNKEVLNLAEYLRSNNINVLIEMNSKRVGKCFKYAEDNNIRYVMIIGENEVNSGTYRIKDMSIKEETDITKEELVKYIKKDV